MLSLDDALVAHLLLLDGRFGLVLLARDLGVHRIGRKIDFSWPGNRRLDEDLSENRSSRNGSCAPVNCSTSLTYDTRRQFRPGVANAPWLDVSISHQRRVLSACCCGAKMQQSPIRARWTLPSLRRQSRRPAFQCSRGAGCFGLPRSLVICLWYVRLRRALKGVLG